jgi:hypothetical protein
MRHIAGSKAIEANAREKQEHPGWMMGGERYLKL